MSKVTAAIRPAPQPAPEPRIVKAPWGTEYRIHDGTIEARTDPELSWHESGIFGMSAHLLAADEATILADLKANPTVQAPVDEDTVELTMPRSVAETLTALAGYAPTTGPIRDHTYSLFRALDAVLDPEHLRSWDSPFTSSNIILKESK